MTANFSTHGFFEGPLKCARHDPGRNYYRQLREEMERAREERRLSAEERAMAAKERMLGAEERARARIDSEMLQVR